MENKVCAKVFKDLMRVTLLTGWAASMDGYVGDYNCLLPTGTANFLCLSPVLSPIENL
jgi:hypothetical protein